jgi:hypothetical protein
MPPVTTVFEPINTGNYILAIVCAMIAIASIITLVFYNRKPSKSKTQNASDTSTTFQSNKFKPLASLGLFFVFLICISTAFFSWLTTTRVTTVTINENYIETNFGKVKWGNIQNIYVHDDKMVAPFSGQEVGKATKILMIVEMNGKTHALSELNYDIREMGRTIQRMRKEIEEGD